MEQVEQVGNLENMDPETGSDSDMLALSIPAHSSEQEQEQERKSRRGGRPRSSVWQHFTVCGGRSDKSRRFNVCCKACGVEMVSRLGAMEKHVAYECAKTDVEAKIKIQGKLAIKSVQAIGQAAKRMKKEKEGRRREFEVLPPIERMPVSDFVRKESIRNMTVSRRKPKMNPLVLNASCNGLLRSE